MHLFWDTLYMYIIIIIKSCWQYKVPRITIVTRSYHSSHLVSLLDYILCPHRPKLCKSFPIGQCRRDDLLKSIRGRPYFFSSIYHVLFDLYEWIVRQEVSGRLSSVLWDIAFGICSKFLLKFNIFSRIKKENKNRIK